MKLADADIGAYEGLIYSTAARYAPLLDDDLEDVQQLLRLKVAQALVAFDSRRSNLPEERYVFSCVRNRVKDMLKAQTRLNRGRGSGSPIYTEDAGGENWMGFEARYLAVAEEQVFAVVDEEKFKLPSTLTWMERQVVTLLLLDLNQTEIAQVLTTSRSRVRKAHATVKIKLADWNPAAAEELLVAA